jgi:hypothetical protein
VDLDQLTAALDEDERVARGALDAQLYITLTITGEVPEAAGDSGARALVQHTHRHDPARVLRWVRAAREILKLHGPNREPAVYSGDSACRGCGFDSREEYMVDPWTDCPVLRALASVYGDTDG